ncbi:MAG: gamma carbonic anhydrase family protein [Desulfocapsaceae bacterium]|nr:gamma carbonic anhydrase family protein [Desulfocapsaceae bacterium]
MMVPYENNYPKIGENVFIAQGVFLIGTVVIGSESSVFFNSVLRADINDIIIGNRTNIQDNCTLHVASDKPVIVGDDVTVGHNVVIHACEIGDNVTIGMSTTIMNGAVIGKNSIVAAGSLVTRNKVFPEGALILGNPAKMIRPLTAEEIEGNRKMAIKYSGVKDKYLQDERKKGV